MVSCIDAGEQFGDNQDTHKVKLGRKRLETDGVELGKMASGLWVPPVLSTPPPILLKVMAIRTEPLIALSGVL